MSNKNLIDFETFFEILKYIRAGNLILEEKLRNPVFVFIFVATV